MLVMTAFLKAVLYPPPDSGLGFWLTDMKNAGFWYWVQCRGNILQFSAVLNGKDSAS